MAEYLGAKRDALRRSNTEGADGFAAFGKDVPLYRRNAALAHARAMGIHDTGKAMAVVERMSEAIRRDQPYDAMQAGMSELDLTGTYRLLAVLCTAQED